MTTYLISISSDNQWGADWGKRRIFDKGGYQPYQGYDQLNTLFDTELSLSSKEFLVDVKLKIKDLIENSVYKSAYKEKHDLLDKEDFKFVIVDNVGPHGWSCYKKGIELVNCDEFAHIDEIADVVNIDLLKQMNRLYICSKDLKKTTFINHNFPQQMREISIENGEN